MVRNTMKLVEQAKRVKSVEYDIFAKNIDDIYRASSNPFELIINGFNFGYMQGMKAARAEQRKNGATGEPADRKQPSNLKGVFEESKEECIQSVIAIMDTIADDWILGQIYLFTVRMTEENGGGTT